jgi:transposase
MDTSINAIVVGVLRPGEKTPVIERIFNDEASVRRLVGRFADRRALSACYEAGPGGYELHRLLTGWGWPPMWSPRRGFPKGSADRVKCDGGTRFGWPGCTGLGS